MNISAIICEFNPMHNGHRYLIDQARKLTKCDKIICFMNGNFSQRAEPTILDKFTRANIAIQCGADLVVQIPTAFGINSAEIFALSAIKQINSFKEIKHLVFGMENLILDKVEILADFLNNESPAFQSALKTNLKSGLNYNNALSKTLQNFKIKGLQKNDISTILNNSNNVLALEYVKNLKKTKSKVVPVAVKREGENFNSLNLNKQFISATKVRELAKNKEFELLKNFVPSECLLSLKNEPRSNAVNFKNIMLNHIKFTKTEHLKNVFAVNEGIDNLIRNYEFERDFDAFFSKLVSKRNNEKRIKKVLLNIMLGIEKSLIKMLYNRVKLPFIRVLAFNSDALKVKTNTSLIVRTSDFKRIKGSYAKKLLHVENRANQLFNLCFDENIYNVVEEKLAIKKPLN